MSDLPALARRVMTLAGERNLSFVTAESCTAGKLSALLSEAPGAAERLHGSFVTYTKANKTRAFRLIFLQRGALSAARLQRQPPAMPSFISPRRRLGRPR